MVIRAHRRSVPARMENKPTLPPNPLTRQPLCNILSSSAGLYPNIEQDQSTTSFRHPDASRRYRQVHNHQGGWQLGLGRRSSRSRVADHLVVLIAGLFLAGLSQPS
jgi:hypothetical protein